MTILNVADIQARLLTIFPEGTEQRTYLTREMAAKTVFTALYANAIEGLDRWIRTLGTSFKVYSQIDVRKFVNHPQPKG